MTDFIRRQSILENLPAIFVSRVLGFKESFECRELRDYEIKIPGVVCSAFANYLQRLHEEALAGAKTDAMDNAIHSAHNVLEFLASSHETEVMVKDEIFESFDCPQKVLTVIRERMGSAAANLFDRWDQDRQE